MAIKDYAGMSDLELEMDDEFELDDEASDEESGEDQEAGDEQEFQLLDSDSETTLDQEAEADEEEELFESGDDSESEIEADARTRDQEYVDRFLEIAGRQYESESEVDQALNETLDGIAQERLFGGLKRLKKWGSKLARNKLLRSLAKKGLSIASGQFPALKAALSLAKGDLQSTIANLGKQMIAGIPGGGAALGALNALGVTQTDNPEENREAWENYVQLSNEAFEHLASNLTPTADQPAEANRLAANAYQHALKRAQARTAATGRRPPMGGAMGGGRLRGRLRGPVTRITLRPGQAVVLRNARKIVVRG